MSVYLNRIVGFVQHSVTGQALPGLWTSPSLAACSWQATTQHHKLITPSSKSKRCKKNQKDAKRAKGKNMKKTEAT